MATILLPTYADPLHTYAIDLDGVSFTLRFDYSGKEDRWYLAIFDASGARVRSWIKLVNGINLIDLAAYDERAPQGQLIAFDLRGLAFDAAGLHDLGQGSRISLFYREAT